MIYTLLVVLAILIALVLDLASADVVFAGALVFLLLGGILSPAEALAGFANPGMVTVGLLFIVSRAVQNTGAFQGIADRFLGSSGAEAGAQPGAAAAPEASDPSRGPALNTRVHSRTRLGRMALRMMIPVGALSAFLNNTPIVTIFTPIVRRWAVARGVAPSRLLIPLSYATILGGACTLIGTSTNLVVHGLALEAGLSGFGFFELARVGVPLAIVGLGYIALVGVRLLPDNRDPMEALSSAPKEYFIEMVVPSGSALAGKSVEEARLRRLPGVYLVDIERDAGRVQSVGPEEPIAAGDRLIFAGRTGVVSEVVSIPGLLPADQEDVDRDTRRLSRNLVEVVVSHTSPAVGRTVREFGFRSVYDASVVAINRNGERLNERLGDVVLRPGDTLVLVAKRGFGSRWRDSQHFYLVSRLDKIAPEAEGKGGVALAIVVAMVCAAALGPRLPAIAGRPIDMFYAAAAAVALLVAARTITPNAARNAIRWEVLITIGAAFGVSRALVSSGAAEAVAGGLVAAFGGFGPAGALAAVYLTTALFTEVVTNNAAAALMVPVALAAAERSGSQPAAFLVAVAIAASASFATPIGYQTNLIVQGVGGYRFRDYLRVGGPLWVLATVVAVISIVVWYGVAP